MKPKLLIAFALIVSGVVASTAFAAEQRNPLHPSYFVNKSLVKTPAHVDSGRIALPSNPLDPGYYTAKGFGTAFVGTAARHNFAHVDNRNPLHPKFRRN